MESHTNNRTIKIKMERKTKVVTEEKTKPAHTQEIILKHFIYFPCLKSINNNNNISMHLRQLYSNKIW